MNETQALQAVLDRTQRRIRLQLVIERATTTATLGLAMVIVSIFFYKSRSLDYAGLVWALAVAAATVVAGALWGLLGRIHPEMVMKRLDVANETRDAMISAFDFMRRLPTEPEGEQRLLMEAQVRHTLQILAQIDHRKASRFRMPRDLGAVGALGVALAAFLVMSLPHQTTEAYVPREPVAGPRLKIDEDLYNEAKDDMKVVEDLARQLKDELMVEFLKEYKALLEALKRGDLSREEFERLYQALMKKYFQGQEQDAANQKGLQQQIQELGKELAKHAATKELGEALKDHDLDAAKKALENLAEKLKDPKLSKTEREQIAKALEQAAKVMENKDSKALDSEMKRQEQELQKQIDQARKQSEDLKRRMDQAKNPQEKERLRRQFNKQKRDLERLERQKQQTAEQRRTLDSLRRSMEDLASQMKRGEKMTPEMQKALEELQKQLSKYQNQSARGGTRGQAQLTLKQLKELLKRLGNKQGQQKGALSDYLDRARQGNQKGQQPCGSCKGSGQKPGGKGKCDSCGGSGSQGGQGAGLQPGGQGGRPGGLTRSGEQPGGQGAGQGGKKWGTGHNPDSVQGKATGLDAKHQAHTAKGQQGKGPSEAQVFQGSADKGFSSTDYRRVYVAYKKIWQKVINQEEVPPGYKYLIERYFRLIKPR
jgi:hypothetical protein